MSIRRNITDTKGSPAAGMDVQKEIERVAGELARDKGDLNGSELGNWLEAERIVAEWLKNRQASGDADDTVKKQPDTETKGPSRSD